MELLMHSWLALQEAELWLLPSRRRGTDFCEQRDAFCHPVWCQALATGRPLSHRVLPKWLLCLTLQGWHPLSLLLLEGGKGGKGEPKDP